MKKALLFFILLCSTTLLTAQKKNTKSTLETRPFVLGEIREINSKILLEKRSLNIYLPPGYKENNTQKFPVIYLLDGSADEDFINIVGLVHYNTFPWIDRMPQSIVVGIANVDRKRDFTSPATSELLKQHLPTAGGSEKFISFIEKELQPFINENYRTDSGNKTIIGQSLGGLLATEILFKKPQLFNKYIIVSPSLWWNDGELLKLNPSLLNEDFTLKTDIYIGVGKEGLSPVFDNHVMEIDANILYDKIKYGKSKSVKTHFDYLPEEDHATVTNPAVFNAFRLLYPKKEN
ncbi:alpha/beta hydrolase-fold protein [Flavobacterium enshiense]|uniref:alpha/beta hydrolase n=1 Tax=Flavobacterium enshiense TaxID=1341165 RepID=UPI00345D422D